MVPIENGDERQLDAASIAAAPRPHASDWLWRPWYAKLWWSAVPAYWIGAAVSVKSEPLAAFYDSALAGYCNVLFFPMTALLVLGAGFARAWIEAPPAREESSDLGDVLIWPERFGKPHPCFDQLDPWSGTLWVGNPANLLNKIHNRRFD